MARPEPTYRTVDTVNGIPCEIECTDTDGTIVGYWAYGYWEPNMPYRGRWVWPEIANIKNG